MKYTFLDTISGYLAISGTYEDLQALIRMVDADEQTCYEYSHMFPADVEFEFDANRKRLIECYLTHDCTQQEYEELLALVRSEAPVSELHKVFGSTPPTPITFDVNSDELPF